MGPVEAAVPVDMGARSDPKPDVPVEEPEFDRSFFNGAVAAVVGADGPDERDGTDVGGVYAPAPMPAPGATAAAAAAVNPAIPPDTTSALATADPEAPGDMMPSLESTTSSFFQSLGTAWPLNKTGCDCAC